MPTFEHMRISLARPPEPPMLEIMQDAAVPVPRGTYLREAFRERRDFLHNQKVFSFVPMPTPEGFSAGLFGRQVTVRGKAGPDKKYVPEELSTNDTEMFVLDLADDQQIAAMEHKTNVGSPKAILESFFGALRSKDGFRDYEPHVRYLSNEETYWSAVDKFRGRISKLEFTFIPPNALKSKETVMDFIRQATQDAGSDTVAHTYSSDAGKINPNANLLEGSAEVALQGGGEVTVKVGKKVVFSSATSKVTTDVTQNEMPADPDDRAGILYIIQRLFKLRV